MSELEKVLIYPDRPGWADLTKEFGAQDETPDLGDDAGPSCFVEEFWRKATVAALTKTDRPVAVQLDMSVPESDIDDDDAPLYKLPAIVKGDGQRTFGKRLGIVRSEEIKNADGDVWLHGYDANNELVDARFIKSAE